MTAVTGRSTGAVDVERYWRDGFLFPLRVVDAEQAQQWRAELEATEAEWSVPGRLPAPFADYARVGFHVVCATAARIAQDDRVLDVIGAVLGPDLMVWAAELIVKEPHSPKVVSIHQDLTYWGLDGADGLVTAWISLGETTVANGAMTFVRSSHRMGQVAHRDTYAPDNQLSRGQEVEVTYDPADAVAVELAPGEMSLHHGLMFHGSGPNTTDQRRVGVAIRYLTPAVGQRVGPTDYAMQVRGVNRSGNLKAIPAPLRDFTPAALRLHEEITAAQRLALAEGATGELDYRR